MSQPAEATTAYRWVADLLTEARARTLLLIAPLSDSDLKAQHDPLMSPIIWDLGHIAQFEELWLGRNLAGPVEFAEMPGMYDPFRNPRAARAALPLPSAAECLAAMSEARRRTLDALESLEPPADSAAGNASALLRDGFVFRMVAQHEYQHDETILQTLQLKTGDHYRAPRAIAPPVAPVAHSAVALAEMVRFPGGEVTVGTDDRSAAYDNERPRHAMRLAPFRIDTVPVTNGDYLAFMDAGGYADRRHWSPAGRAWLAESCAEAPKYWYREGGEWHARSMDRCGPVVMEHPVCHVCFHEADAYARWAGKRLPTEYEWEAAATWDPVTGMSRAFPWGDEMPGITDANIDQLAFGTAVVGSYPRNVSPIGCHQMIGDVWEWTASDFRPYPGYATFPYREYSEVFFGDEYKVLRGGSWATRPGVVRTTFRNWDYPIRRQIFSGFRCARDD